MNKVMLIGRLTRDPEVRYSNSAEPLAICRYSLAVNRRFKKDNETGADFINCVSFGKAGEFAEKYFKKGMQIAVVGRIQVSTYDDKDGVKKWSTEVVVEEQEFTESKSAFEGRGASSNNSYSNQPTNDMTNTSNMSNDSDGFSAISESIDDDDLPF
jgi:single-strand DNA-binding protein